MAENKSFIIRWSEIITNWSLYLLLFLVPLFFLPWTSDALDFNKQALLVILTFISLSAWMAKVMASGSLKIKTEKIYIVAGVLFLAYGASTIFSMSSADSFWGFAGFTWNGLLSLMCFLIVYFLVSNTFSEKEIRTSFLAIGFSALVAEVYAVLQLCGLHIIPLAFTQNSSFNTVGSLGSLALLSVVLLPLCIILLMQTDSWKRILFGINAVLVLAVLVLINYTFIWWLLLAVMVVLIVFWVTHRNLFDSRLVSLPMFFLIVSLVFILFSPQLTFLAQRSPEVSLSHQATLAIDTQVVKSSPLLGSGPGTFGYDFAKYKSQDFNNGYLWNAPFSFGSSRILTDLATVGGLGTLAFLALALVSLYYGLKRLIFDRARQATGTVVTMVALLVVVISLMFGFFLYPSNMVLDLLFFFALAALTALMFKDQTAYTLAPSSLFTLMVTFAITIVFILGLGVVMIGGQRYLAEVYHTKALVAFNENKKADAVGYLAKAASNNRSSDLYFNQLSLLSLSRLQDELAKPSSPDDKEKEKAIVQGMLSDSINSITVATNLDPKNADNWSAKGYVCQNLRGLVSDATDCSIKAYDMAITLNPNSPYYPLQQGNTYLSEAASLSQDQASGKPGLLSQAKDKYNQALTLKPDYSAAYFQLALVAKASQDDKGESNALDSAQKYAAGDPQMMFQVGIVHYQDKDWAKAQAAFRGALSMAPNFADALYYSGLTYDQQGRKDDAIAAFSRLLELAPASQDIQKIISNLKAGNSALLGLTSQPPEPAPNNNPLPLKTSPSPTPAPKK